MEWKSLALGLGLGLLLMPLLAYLTLRLVVWLVKRKLTQLATRLNAQMTPPTQVNVEPMSRLSWHDPRVQQFGQELEELEYHALGGFRIRQMPGVQLSAWMDGEHSVYGIIYEQPGIGAWCELVSLYPDGSGFTTSSLPASGAAPSGRHPIHRLNTASVGCLVQYHLEHRPPGCRELNGADFAPEFERCYRESMAAQPAQIVEAQVIDVVEEEIVNLPNAPALSASTQLQESFQAKFLEKTQLTPAEWERVRHVLMFVHDGLDDEQLKAMGFHNLPAEGTPRQRVRGHGQLLGSLTEPLPADVYIPEGHEA